jgi:hypothetical protein
MEHQTIEHVSWHLATISKLPSSNGGNTNLGYIHPVIEKLVSETTSTDFPM